MSSGRGIRINSTAGLAMPSDDWWVTCCGRLHKHQIVFAVQVTIAYVVILTSLINITFTSENTCLWATLASATLGYLLPSPSFKNEPPPPPLLRHVAER
jgi:hypothetical protein